MPDITIRDAGRYRVALARAVKIGGIWLRPGEKHVFDGATIKRLEAAPESRGAVEVVSDELFTG